MKTLDRYILRSMLESYLICILIVLLFYVIIDLFSNLDKFREYLDIQKKANQPVVPMLVLISQYYSCQSPIIFYNLSPIITMMAAMFTLTRMARGNELTPLKACGISMYRLFNSFLFFALLVSLLMIGLQEIVIPYIAPDMERLENVKQGRDLEIQGLQYRDEQGRLFYVRKYYPPQQKLEDIRIIIPHESKEMKPKRIIEAQEGGWRKIQKETVLVVKQGKITNYDEFGGTEGKPSPIAEEGYALKTSLRDRHFTYPERKNLDMVSSRHLRNLLEKTPDFAEAKVTLQTRISFPISNFVLLLLCLPLMLRKQTNNFFLGTGICAIVSGAFYGIYILFINLGYKEVLNPVFAAWFPTILFGSLSASFLTIVST